MKTEEPDQNFISNNNQKKQSQVCQIIPGQSLQPGMTCPRCHQGMIDYDGMLHLVCPTCGLTEAGACT